MKGAGPQAGKGHVGTPSGLSWDGVAGDKNSAGSEYLNSSGPSLRARGLRHLGKTGDRHAWAGTWWWARLGRCRVRAWAADAAGHDRLAMQLPGPDRRHRPTRVRKASGCCARTRRPASEQSAGEYGARARRAGHHRMAAAGRGHRDPWAELLDWAADTAPGRARVCLIRGARGSGKSHLLTWFILGSASAPRTRAHATIPSAGLFADAFAWELKRSAGSHAIIAMQT